MLHDRKITSMFETFKEISSVASPLVVLIGAVVSIYVVATLAPLKQDLALGSQRIFAVEEQIKELKQIQLDRVSKNDVENMNKMYTKRFDDIQNQLTWLIQAHVK